MKRILTAAAATTLALGLTAPAMADNHENKAPKPEVVETNAKGQATKVKIGDNTYDVCMTESQDSCINPRAAGLKWGNRPLSYWPGKPASEM